MSQVVIEGEYISKEDLYTVIGYISAELANESGAFEGKAPEWFPEPPQWIELTEEALEAIEDAEPDLLDESNPMVWAERFVKLVHKNPSIAFDVETMVGWFASAMDRGQMNTYAIQQQEAENPLNSPYNQELDDEQDEFDTGPEPDPDTSLYVFLLSY